MKIKSPVEKGIEAVLQNRIKHIGENEQLYTGYPAQLIQELMSAITKNYK